MSRAGLPEPTLAAAILAGGRARRLGGSNKAMLRVGGARIIDRQLAALRQITDTIFVVAADAAPYTELGLRVVPDVVPGAGALGGIYTAIVASPRERTLILACDLPFVPADLLRRLASTSDADLSIPRSGRGYEPLCAVYAKSCAAPIRARIERGDLRASVLPPGLRVEEIGPEALATYDPHGLLFVNVNTPHDYERARGLIELGLKPMQDRITEAPAGDGGTPRSYRGPVTLGQSATDGGTRHMNGSDAPTGHSRQKTDSGRTDRCAEADTHE